MKKFFEKYKDKIFVWICVFLIAIITFLVVFFHTQDVQNMANKQSDISISCDNNLNTSWTIDNNNIVNNNYFTSFDFDNTDTSEYSTYSSYFSLDDNYVENDNVYWYGLLCDDFDFYENYNPTLNQCYNHFYCNTNNMIINSNNFFISFSLQYYIVISTNNDTFESNYYNLSFDSTNNLNYVYIADAPFGGFNNIISNNYCIYNISSNSNHTFNSIGAEVNGLTALNTAKALIEENNVSSSNFVDLYIYFIMTINQVGDNLILSNYVGDTFYNASNYNALNSSYTQLQSDYNTLNSSYTQLQTTYNNLVASNQQLQSDYNTLQTTYNNLVASNQQLQIDYNTLNGLYTQLQIDYNTLNGLYTQLQSDYNNLQATYDEAYNEGYNDGYEHASNLVYKDNAFYYATLNYYMNLSINTYAYSVLITENYLNGNQFIQPYNLLKSHYSSEDLRAYVENTNLSYFELVFDSSVPFSLLQFKYLCVLGNDFDYNVSFYCDDNYVWTYHNPQYVHDNNDNPPYNEFLIDFNGSNLENRTIYKMTWRRQYNYEIGTISNDQFAIGYSEGVNDTTIRLNQDIKTLEDEKKDLQFEIRSLQETLDNSLNTLAYTFISSVMSTPFNILHDYLNWNFFGINLFSLFTSLITLLLVIWVIKFLLGRK